MYIKQREDNKKGKRKVKKPGRQFACLKEKTGKAKPKTNG
jgi:hypothetical protein